MPFPAEPADEEFTPASRIIVDPFSTGGTGGMGGSGGMGPRAGRGGGGMAANPSYGEFAD
jgi:hypothetical protein